MDKISQIMKLAQACGYGPHYGKFVADHPELLERDAQIPAVGPNAKVYNCAFCGTEFYRNDKKAQRYCSEQCKQDANNARAREKAKQKNPPKKMCPVCGKEFTAKSAKFKYCGPFCKKVGHIERVKEYQARKGEGGDND